MEDVLFTAYGLHPIAEQKSAVGAGSDTYFVTCTEGKFVLKFPSSTYINHPEQEPQLAEYLLSRGLPVSQFIKTVSGSYFAHDSEGRLCTLQKFIGGTTPEWNTASDALLWQQAELLGKIHYSLRDCAALPVGIGEGFFRNMTPERAKKSYQSSLAIARQIGDNESI